MGHTAPKERTPKAQAQAKGAHSRAALIEKHRARDEKCKQLKLAVEYSRENGACGARAVKSSGKFPSLSVSQINNALHGRIKMIKDGERHSQEVLTDAERTALATWIEQCATRKCAAKDAHISAQVILMLKARKIDNRQRKHGRGTIPLTASETRLVTEADAQVSHTWLMHFNARFPHLQRKGEKNADSARTKKQNEGVVTNNFYGEFGIVATLEHIGKIGRAHV